MKCRARHRRHSRSALAAIAQALEPRLCLSTFTVTNTNDSGSGSLRQAIINASNAISADQIVFDTAHVFALPRVISLQSDLPLLEGGNLQITGPGSSYLTIRRDPGASNFRIFDSASPFLRLSGLTLSRGNASDGGAIKIGASTAASLDDVLLSDNHAGTGGAIFVDEGGALTVRNSTISGNTSSGGGGGIYFYSGGSLLIENTTISGNNSANGGGGLYFFGDATSLIVRNSTINNNSTTGDGGGLNLADFGGLLQIQNSTITANVAASNGGGVALNGPGSMIVQNSTITGNTAQASDQDYEYGGGGLARTSASDGTITITNSIVSGNNNPLAPDIFADPLVTTTDVNYSAIGSTDGFVYSPDSDNNLPEHANLQLGQLTNNGGPTHTILPKDSSPLVGAGSKPATPAELTTDQRGAGFVRFFGSNVDIGAAEVQPLPYPIAIANTSNITAPGAKTYTFSVSYADAGAANNGINVSTLIGNNFAVRIGGPDGFSAFANYVSISNSNNGTPRTVTYSFTPPGGTWDGVDSGNYSIYMQSGQVRDLDFIAVPAGIIGSFTVKIPQTFIVSNSNDSGPGSLRDAIGRADAAPTADIVTFLPAFFSSPRIISLSSALPEITGELTINGPGDSLLTVQRDSAASSLFGLLASSATALNISGITLSGGHASFEAGGLNITGVNPIISLDGVIFSDNISEEGGGGAIALDDFALLSIRNSTISGNTSGGSGGGIYFYGGGSLVLENSTVSGNSANTGHNGYGGGGIYFYGDVSTQNVAGFVPGTLVIRNSTISNNSTPLDGGGIYLQSFDGTLLVQNSTISGNSAAGFGGAVDLVGGIGSLVVQNSTISGNSAGTGGGIVRDSIDAGNITITNSIVSGNSGAMGPDILAAPATTTLANFSAIGSSAGFAIDPASANNLPFGANLLLGPLANNGGASPTLLPQTGSPLIGAGSNASTPAALTTDQRGAGFARIFGSTIDIGAIEVQPIPYPLGTASISNITTAGATTYTFTVTYFDAGAANNGINMASVIGNNSAVRVLGPDGFNVPATYVSVNDSTNGTPRTVTYSFTPPGGAWDALDSGNYILFMQTGQVKDLDGNAVPAGTLGTFSVKIPQIFVVSNTDDSGPGSLRDAISRANAFPLADIITFSPTLFSSEQIIFLSASLLITGQLTITGPGASLLTIEPDPDASGFRLLNSSATLLNISGIAFSGGQSFAAGGGLRVTGLNPVVSLDDVVFSENSSGTGGGAIAFEDSGFLALRNSTISGNTSGAGGGGIYFYSGGSLVVENSTVSGNTSASDFGGYYSYSGGGIYFVGDVSTQSVPGFVPGVIVIRNSTVDNNSSGYDGGGIYLESSNGTLLIQNSTISGNSAFNSGGGVAVDTGSIVVQNSTISDNSADASGGGIARTAGPAGTITIANSIVSGNSSISAPDIFATAQTITLVNSSAIGSADGFTMAAGSGNNLVFGTDLLLGPLADNGGPTETMLPQSGSPLINAGSNALNPAGLSTDQRGSGFARILGASVDIGAVEATVDTILPAVQSSAFTYITSPQSIRYTFSEPVILDKSALELHNVSNSTIIPLDKIAFTYDSATNTATFTFPGYLNGVLPDGDYRAFLLKSAVQDSSQNHPAIDHMMIFNFLLGDLNNDRTVSIADFITLASNFGKTGVTYPDGDVNYDGIVSISDFLDLASKFNTSLPPPPPAAAPAADISITADSLISAPRQTRRHPSKRHHHPRPKAAESMMWSRFFHV